MMPQLRERAEGPARPRSVHADDFARIFGIETEYGVSATGAGVECPSQEVASAMFRPVVSRSRSSNAYLANGARLYLDVGSHPEYATAEARDPRTAMIQDAAGEALMRSLAMQAQEALRTRHGAGLRVHLYKNNVDSAGHAFGCHENYLVRRQVSLDAVERQLLPFLITRQLISGAGRVDPRGFQLSQRAAFLEEGVSSSTTRDRPMVNTRDEPHADPDQFRRLHVIIGDSNRIQYATMTKLALTHLVLCVIEYGVRTGTPTGFEACALCDPSAGNRAVSADTGCADARLELEDSMGFRECEQRFLDDDGDDDDTQAPASRHADDNGPTAVRMQEHYWRVVRRFVREHGEEIDRDTPGFDARETCRAWRGLLDDVIAGDIDALADRVDWAAKRRLLTRMECRLPQGGGRAALQRLDMDYHDLANGSVFASLQRHGLVGELATRQEVLAALHEPPHDTRAWLRGAFVARALDASLPFSCDWTHMALGAHGQAGDMRAQATLLDPFDTTGDAEYRALMEQLDH